MLTKTTIGLLLLLVQSPDDDGGAGAFFLPIKLQRLIDFSGAKGTLQKPINIVEYQPAPSN